MISKEKEIIAYCRGPFCVLADEAVKAVSYTHLITPVKLIIGILLLFFSLVEVLPFFKKMEFGGNRLIFGGILSGFFGGLAGIPVSYTHLDVYKRQGYKQLMNQYGG